MSDGSIKIDTKIDNSPLEKGIKETGKQLNKLEKETAKITKKSGINWLELAGKIDVAKTAVGAASKVVGYLTETYDKQIKAETLLQSAAKNNPYIDDYSVSKLKEYAGALQNISTVGDEELLPFMAQLVTSGRTDAQIMDIMAVAVDVSATGIMSLDSAVKNLNKTYGGLSGELGETIPEIKQLSAEQLKNGDAVKIMADKYKGMSKSVVDASPLDKVKQLTNSFGDLIEAAAGALDEAGKSIGGFDLLAAAKSGLNSLTSFINDTMKMNRLLREGKKEELSLTDQLWIAEKKVSETRAKASKTKADKDINELAYWQEIKSALSEKIEKEKELAQLAAEAKNRTDTIKERDKEAAKYIEKNTEARKKAIQQIELQAAAEGKNVDLADILNAYMNSYVSLIGESGGLVTENNSAAVGLLETIKKITAEYEEQNKLQKEAKKLKDKLTDLLDSIQAKDGRKASEKMEDQLKLLDEYYQQVIDSEHISSDEKIKIEEDYTAKRKILLDLQKEAVEEEKEAEVEATRKAAEKMLQTIADFADQAKQIAQGLANFANAMVKSETDTKLAELETQKEQGLISVDEYNEKKAEIEFEAAQKKYQLDLFVWASSILAATANTALGVSKALEMGVPAGIIAGALAAAVGAVQIATIIASKPIPPKKYASGGIVTGGIAGRDSVNAMLMPGEIVFNKNQQRELWETANGKRSSSGTNIVIHNSAANMVDAQPQVSKDQINVMIDARVTQSMGKGRYNSSYRQMQSGIDGTLYAY